MNSRMRTTTPYIYGVARQAGWLTGRTTVGEMGRATGRATAGAGETRCTPVLVAARFVALAWVLVAAATLVSEPALAAGDAPASFFADRRAREVGDMLTVVITEFSTVAATARTSTSKAEGASASLLHGNNELDVASADFDTKFAGGGQIERTGKLVAKLAVTVSGLDANGNLVVHGEQDIEVNNERQRIRLDGIVRPEDIGPDNTIPSWRVSGAQIEFTGKGLLARKQAPGLITRVLSWFGW